MGNYNKQERHDEYEFYKARGLCPLCRKRAAAPNRVACPECLEASMLRSAANRDKTVEHEKRRKRYYELKAAGICVSCKHREAEQGHVKCKVCQRKQIVYNRSHYVHKINLPGICSCRNCNEPTVEGKAFCKYHYEKMVEHAAMMRKTSMERGTWKRWNNDPFFQAN
jgi:hypothetical protein